MFKIFGVRDFLPSNSAIKWLAQNVCSKEDLKTLCSNALFIIAGFDKKQLNEVRKDDVVTSCRRFCSKKKERMEQFPRQVEMTT